MRVVVSDNNVDQALRALKRERCNVKASFAK
jgi:ribosomal protein S21